MTADEYWIGAFGGLVASLLMYALLFPISGRDPLPPQRFAAKVWRLDERSPYARFYGFLLQLAFGIFWGLAMAAWNDRYFPLKGSYVVQGLVWGLAAFAFSVAGFATLRTFERPLRLDRWAGYFVGHLVFGAALGVFFVFAGLPAKPI